MENYPFTTPTDAISAFHQEFDRSKMVEELIKALHFNNAKPGSAHIAFSKLDFKTIITTNFDCLLEKAYESVGKSHWLILDEDQLSVSTAETFTVILKFHGDVVHPRRLIITEEDYDTFLHRYPLLSTYVSNLLISATPILIGFSLEDPDLRRLWNIIGNRLGNLRRSAYTFLVNPSMVEIARFKRRGIRVISLPGSTKDYNKILTTLFQELDEYWKVNLKENIIPISDEKMFSTLALPQDSETRMCFFALPAKLQTYYKRYIFPIVERFGFTPITANDVLSIGDNILAKISMLIEESAIIVADGVSSSVWADVGMAKGKGRKVILIMEKMSKIPFVAEGFTIIQRPIFPEPPDDNFISLLEKIFDELSKSLEINLYNEPTRLLNKKEYRAAVISAIILFEVELRDITETILPAEARTRFFTFREDLRIAKEFKILTEEECEALSSFYKTRSLLVHTKKKITAKSAKRMVNEISTILENAKNRVNQKNR